MFQEAELSYILGGTSKAPKTKIFYTSSKKVVNNFFLKTLSDNSFYIFYKLNQTILLVCKTLKAFFCVESFFSFYIFFVIYKFTIKFYLLLYC